MPASFPRASKGDRGYKVEEVDRFLKFARIAFDGRDNRARLSAAEVRQTAFTIKRNGYSFSHVDAALERIEDAFAARERELTKTSGLETDRLDHAKSQAQILINRLARPDDEKFTTSGPLARGYRRSDVDAFAVNLTGYFRGEVPITLTSVRTVSFRTERGGYKEAHVDAFLDSVVEVMLAIR